MSGQRGVSSRTIRAHRKQETHFTAAIIVEESAFVTGDSHAIIGCTKGEWALSGRGGWVG